jgi:hypothetical protein
LAWALGVGEEEFKVKLPVQAEARASDSESG